MSEVCSQPVSLLMLQILYVFRRKEDQHSKAFLLQAALHFATWRQLTVYLVILTPGFHDLNVHARNEVRSNTTSLGAVFGTAVTEMPSYVSVFLASVSSICHLVPTLLCPILQLFMSLLTLLRIINKEAVVIVFGCFF